MNKKRVIAAAELTKTTSVASAKYRATRDRDRERDRERDRDRNERRDENVNPAEASLKQRAVRDSSHVFDEFKGN